MAFRQVDGRITVKCPECGFSDRVPREWAGKTIACDCGCKILVPARRKATSLYMENVNYGKYDEVYATRGIPRCQFALGLLATIGVCFVSMSIFGLLSLGHLIVVIGVCVAQIALTSSRLENAGASRVHLVPTVFGSFWGIAMNIALLKGSVSPLLVSPVLGVMNLIFGFWGFGVLLYCLCKPPAKGNRV